MNWYTTLVTLSYIKILFTLFKKVTSDYFRLSFHSEKPFKQISQKWLCRRSRAIALRCVKSCIQLY